MGFELMGFELMGFELMGPENDVENEKGGMRGRRCKRGWDWKTVALDDGCWGYTPLLRSLCLEMVEDFADFEGGGGR
jgi:hypothetical protein